MNLYNKRIQHQMGVPFYPISCWFKIPIDEQDINYLTSVIKKDKCYEFIKNCFIADKTSKLQKAYAEINQIVFYYKFYNDSKCPKGMKIILFTLLGRSTDYVNKTFPNLLSFRYPYVEQWLQRIRDN